MLFCNFLVSFSPVSDMLVPPKMYQARLWMRASRRKLHSRWLRQQTTKTYLRDASTAHIRWPPPRKKRRPSWNRYGILKGNRWRLWPQQFNRLFVQLLVYVFRTPLLCCLVRFLAGSFTSFSIPLRQLRSQLRTCERGSKSWAPIMMPMPR